MDCISLIRTLLATILVVAVVSGVAGIGVLRMHAASSATASSNGDRAAPGTIVLTDSDDGTGTLADLTGETTPGSSRSRCIRVTHDGGRTPAAVKLYRSSIDADATGRYELRVERGAGLSAPAPDMNCAGFDPVADAFAAADLVTLGTTYGTGVDAKQAGAAWSAGDSVDYRFTITVRDGVPNGNTTSNDTGVFRFEWEARPWSRRAREAGSRTEPRRAMSARTPAAPATRAARRAAAARMH